MDVCILMGSPRRQGNTAALLEPFREELEQSGAQTRTIWLYEKNIQPCIACRTCQRDWSRFGCVRKDDAEAIFQVILESELMVLATPIYSWYCTPPMKAALDRLVYGMNKFYGSPEGDENPKGKKAAKEPGPSLWEGKHLAIIATCGYRPERGADLFEEGIKRYCRHSRLRFLGMLAERHMGYGTVFMDAEKESRAREFAKILAEA